MTGFVLEGYLAAKLRPTGIAELSSNSGMTTGKFGLSRTLKSLRSSEPLLQKSDEERDFFKQKETKGEGE